MKAITFIKTILVGIFILLGNSVYGQHSARVFVIDPNTSQTLNTVNNPNQNPLVLYILYTKSDTNDFEVSFGLENHDSNSIYHTTKTFEFTNPTYNPIDSTYSETFIDTFSFFHPTYMHDLIVDNTNPIKMNQSWKFQQYLSDFEIGFGIPYMAFYTYPNGYYYDSTTVNSMFGGIYGLGCSFVINENMDSVFLNADHIGVEVDFLRYAPDGDCDTNAISVSTYDSSATLGYDITEQYIYDIPEDSVLHVQRLISPENFRGVHFGLTHQCNTYFDNVRLYPVYDRYICQGDSIEINGLFVFDEGVYIDSLFTALGTDSIIGINVKFNDILHGDTIHAEFCEGDGYIVNDTLTLLTEGLHEISTTSIHGCDSLFYINLEERLNTISTSITNTNNVLSYDDPQSDYTYQWINVSTGQPIVGEISSIFTPSDNGTYAVEVSNGVCTQVSNSSLTNIGLEDLTGQITCTPNPFINSIELSFGDNPLSGFVEVFDVNSKLLMTSNFDDTESLSLDTEDLPNGIYLIKIKTNNGLYQKKMIK